MNNDSIEYSHLLPLNTDANDSDQESDSDLSSIASDIEVDHTDHVKDHFVRLNLDNDSSESEDEFEDFIPCAHANNTAYSLSTTTTAAAAATTTTVVTTAATATTTTNHKRRQWTFSEKLKILRELDQGASLHALESKYKCTRKMIRDWNKNRNQLVNTVKEQGGKGKKRKRIDGAGAKLNYCNLDQHLIKWYRSKRGSDRDGVDVPKEKVTFKGLVRQGQRYCIEIKSNEPSKKWFTRFLKRHRLSLQKPVRKRKISLPEAYSLIEKFHVFLRRCNQLGPKRGVMGCFTESDICNVDESPLNLWGDQSKRCINDINTKNEIDGNLDDKRFATVILCVFPENNHRIQSVLLYKGSGRVLTSEEQHYSPHLKVFFTPKAVINTSTMDKYVSWWFKKVNDGNRKLFITDSCTSHLNIDIKNRMRENGVCLAIIPGGCTQYIQLLDVYVFSSFKNHYYDCCEEYLEKYGPRSKIKLTSSQKRILCTRFTAAAWSRTLKSVNFPDAFRSLGYTWIDNAVIQPNHMKWYRFDPNLITTDEPDIEEITDDSDDVHIQHPIKKPHHKQMSLVEMWKK